MACSCIPECVGECTLQVRQAAKRERVKQHFLDKHKWGQPEHRSYVTPVVGTLEEKHSARSWVMACGHWTDWETQLLYAHAKPKGKDDFCDSCGQWEKRPPRKKPEPIPDEPLF